MKKQIALVKKINSKNTNQPKNKDNKSKMINMAVGITIGGALGGLTGAALSDKKTRKVFGNAVFEFVRSVLEGIEKISIDSSDN